MGDVDPPGAELPGQRLREGALGELARREVGELDAPPQRGRGAGDDQGGRVGGRGVHGAEEEGEGGLGEVEEAVSGLLGGISACESKFCACWILTWILLVIRRVFSLFSFEKNLHGKQEEKGRKAHAFPLRLPSRSSSCISKKGLSDRPAPTL